MRSIPRVCADTAADQLGHRVRDGPPCLAGARSAADGGGSVRRAPGPLPEPHDSSQTRRKPTKNYKEGAISVVYPSTVNGAAPGKTETPAPGPNPADSRFAALAPFAAIQQRI